MTDSAQSIPYTTDNAGIPVESDEHSLTIGDTGPILLQDHYLIEKMAQFNRERVPERVVHAKGGGAYGHFEVTGDVSRYTKADLFQPGRRTDLLARFSTVAGELGSPDTWRDPRGFALKFYTRHGNYDLVGNNTPVFFVRDPQKFQDFIRSQKRHPRTGLRDNDMQWDFWTLSPESAHMVTWLMGDRGIPRTWRHMNGYGSHTFLWVNEAGEKFWIKYHFRTDQGVEFLTQADADELAGHDADRHRRDLYEAIEDGDAPSWTLYVQVMPFEAAADYRFNPFDLTKVWPHTDHPLIEVGRMTLDRNPEDHFVHIEQAAFEPSSMVPGIGPSPDKMLLGRLFSYPDTHRYRIGPNYQQLPPNRPHAPVASYAKDGPMRYQPARVSRPYAPNSYGGPAADTHRFGEIAGWAASGEMVREAYRLHREDDDWGQAGTMVRQVLDDAARERLASNVAGHLSAGVSDPVLERALQYWRAIDKALGDRIAARINGR
ncbi:catalase [Streptomyces triculaminicus]|uniref:Catalase n=1 Tax=Streptomyces triculaminicus TaxID=2816232 RepID=A0A939FPC8_9ACTN|nr:catalase [Streptomyces triculaminicus]MBO0654819.1 catalase [Streptomyces triculaminicus]